MTTRTRGPYPRTRGMGKLSPINGRTFGGGLTPTYSQTYDIQAPNSAASGRLKTTSDIVTPGWREILGSGGRINNPFDSYVQDLNPYNSSHYRTWSYPGGTAWETTEGPTVSRIFGVLSDPGLLTLDPNSPQQAATIQAWAGVANPDTLAWVTLLESHKSVRMILTRARALARVVEACRTGKFANVEKALGRRVERRAVPRKFLKWDSDGEPILTRRGTSKYAYSAPVLTTEGSLLDQASRLWLETRFGWRPLVYDIVSSMKALYAADLRSELTPKDVYVSRGYATASRTVSANLTGTLSGLTYSGVQVSAVEYKVRTYVHYRWTNPDGILRRLNDFGLFDIPQTLWELVPFSFMVDRIAPVGQWLGALTPKLGVNVLDAGHVLRRKTTVDKTLTGPASQVVGGVSYPPAAPLGSKDQATYESLVRKTFLSLPAFPPVNLKVDIPKVTDIFALWRQLR